MTFIKRNWIWLIVLIAGVVVFAAFRFNRPNTAEYFTSKVERGDIRDVIQATGTINPVTSVQVGSQVSGMVSKLYVDFNSKVKKGQVIAEIDPSLFQGAVLQARADVQNAQAALAAAKANLAKDEATLKQNQLDFKRFSNLTKQGVTSQQQLDQARAANDGMTAQVGSDRAAIQQMEAQIAQKTANLKVSETNLAYTVIRAPIDGTVVNRSVDIGQTVAASLQAPTLFTIALDLTKMQVYAKTDEGDVGQIRPGLPVDFQVDAFPKEVFHGVVYQVRMNATTVQNVVTYDTIVNFDNPQLKLFPGMTAYVSIPVASANDVVKLPNAALRYHPDFSADRVQELYQRYGIKAPSGAKKADSTVVWQLLADKSLKPLQVHIGLTDHSYTAMLSGDLQAGDQLVTGAAAAKSGPAAPGLGGPRR